MEYDNDSGEFLGNWPISKAEREARLRRRRLIRRVVKFCILGVVLSAMVWAAFQVDWRTVGRNAGPIAGSAWRGIQEAGAWCRSGAEKIKEGFAETPGEMDLGVSVDSTLSEIDASPCAGDYESRHHAYWSILTEAVSSNHSKDEIRQIAENNRELAVDTLMRLRQIVRESEALPKTGGSAEDLKKLDDLEKRLDDYVSFRHEILERNVMAQRPGGRPDAFSWSWLTRDSGGFILLALMVVCGVCYFKAYRLVTCGSLTVYDDWGDFLVSVLWLFLSPVGYGALFAEDLSIVWRLIGLVVWGVAAWSLWRMVAGAFKYNSSHCWIALGARIAVAMLALFAVARLNEKIQAYRRRELGIIRGVLIPLVVFALVYRYGICPMIGRKGW